MSLSNYAGANVAGFLYTGTAEVGIISASVSKSISATNEDMGIDPVTGKVSLYGIHCDESVQVSISGISLSGGLANTTVGSNYTFATSMAVAGHAASPRTTVITSITADKDNAGGKFQTFAFNAISLPF